MTNAASSERGSAAPAIDPNEIERLRAALKRCSPATFEAACHFHKTGGLEHLTTLLDGVIERYVQHDLRPRLHSRSDDLRLVEDLGIDSLAMMEIVLLAEDVLHISVTTEELVKIRTLGDIRHFVVHKTQSPILGRAS